MSPCLLSPSCAFQCWGENREHHCRLGIGEHSRAGSHLSWHKSWKAVVALDILESPPETLDLCRDISDLPVKPKSCGLWSYQWATHQRMATIHSGQGGTRKSSQRTLLVRMLCLDATLSKKHTQKSHSQVKHRDIRTRTRTIQQYWKLRGACKTFVVCIRLHSCLLRSRHISTSSEVGSQNIGSLPRLTSIIRFITLTGLAPCLLCLQNGLQDHRSWCQSSPTGPAEHLQNAADLAGFDS